MEKKIKSEKANERISQAAGIASEFTYDIEVVEISQVYKIVGFAEQDAEERAVKAFEEWLRKENPTFDGATWSRLTVDSFKQLLNGGQSDE